MLYTSLQAGKRPHRQPLQPKTNDYDPSNDLTYEYPANA